MCVHGTSGGFCRAESSAAQSLLCLALDPFGIPASAVPAADGACLNVRQFALCSADRFWLFARSQSNSERPSPVTFGAAAGGAKGEGERMTGGVITGPFGRTKTGWMAGDAVSRAFGG